MLRAGKLTPLMLQTDSSGSTACHVACQRNNKIAVQFFNKYVPAIMTIRDKDGVFFICLLTSCLLTSLVSSFVYEPLHLSPNHILHLSTNHVPTNNS